MAFNSDVTGKKKISSVLLVRIKEDIENSTIQNDCMNLSKLSIFIDSQ